MAFPLPLAAKLTGATPHQLRSWRAKELVVPEVSATRPPLYSFRDLVLLRSLAYLRAGASLQKISKAFTNLNALHLMAHPSEYKFGTDGRTVYVGLSDGSAVDLVRRPGQIDLFTFEEISREFENFKGEPVAEFTRPGSHLELRPQRMGGWPTIEGTRVPYDAIADLVDFATVMPEDVPSIYPSVTQEAAESAVEFDRQVKALGAA